MLNPESHGAFYIQCALFSFMAGVAEKCGAVILGFIIKLKEPACQYVLVTSHGSPPPPHSVLQSFQRKKKV